MPMYSFGCDRGHHFDRFVTLAHFCDPQACDCGAVATRRITAPVLVMAQPECRYDSPIDGRPITTWAQREDDLARSHCRPYDPGMKQDANRTLQESTEALDRAVSETVESSIARMSTAKRASLHRELCEQGAGVNLVRETKTS